MGKAGEEDVIDTNVQASGTVPTANYMLLREEEKENGLTVITNTGTDGVLIVAGDGVEIDSPMDVDAVEVRIIKGKIYILDETGKLIELPELPAELVKRARQNGWDLTRYVPEDTREEDAPGIDD